MTREDKFLRSEIKEIIIYVFIGTILFVILPIVGGFFLKGFSESFTSEGFSVASYLGSFIIYFFMMFGAIALIIYPIARLAAINREEHPATQKNASWFTIFTVSLIHAPEENGALYNLFKNLKLESWMRWNLSIVRCICIGIIVFGLLGILTVSNPQLSISGVPNTNQQISTASDVIFGAAVPSFAENGVLCFIFFLALGFVALLCSRFKLGLIGFFLIGFVFICPLMGLAWMQMHNIVYGNDEAALIATFIFGFVGSALTLLTASFVFWLIWHFMNNFFIKLAEEITRKEDIFFIAILIWVLSSVVYLAIEFLMWRYKRRRRARAMSALT